MPAVLVVRDARPADYEHSTCLLLTLRRVSDTESNIKLGLFNASQAGISPFDFPTIWVKGSLLPLIWVELLQQGAWPARQADAGSKRKHAD